MGGVEVHSSVNIVDDVANTNVGHNHTSYKL
jgi:hypothetical protein